MPPDRSPRRSRRPTRRADAGSAFEAMPLNGPVPRMVDLQTAVDVADDLIDDIQGDLDRVNHAIDSAHQRNDPARANPRRIARIWTEGGLDRLERDFEKQGAHAPVARSRLMSAWKLLKGDKGFRHALRRMRTDVAEAAADGDRLSQEADMLQGLKARVLDTINDFSALHGAGVREVPLHPLLDKPEGASLRARTDALSRTAEAGMERAPAQLRVPDKPEDTRRVRGRSSPGRGVSGGSRGRSSNR